MIDKRNSVSYMKEYLKHAVVFERYVYIWEQAMNEANKHMRNIYDRKINLGNAINSNSERIKSNAVKAKNINREEQAKRCSKHGKVELFVSISMLLMIVVLVAVASQYGSNNIKETLVLAVVVYLAMCVFTVVGLTCFILFIVNRSNYNKLKREMKSPFYHQESTQQKEIRLTNDLKAVKNQEAILVADQDQIFKNLNAAKSNRATLYSENVLPQKYRSYSTVATLYEYLETGRCNTVQGHGGIYDTYENDLRQGLIIENLIEINQRLKNIESNQHLLYQEMRQANNTLSYINANLYEIKRTNKQIAENTAISAVANQQAASSAQYVAWRMGQTVF